MRNRGELEPLIEQRLSALGAEETTRRLAAADIPFARVNDLAALAGHAQLQSRERWFRSHAPGGPIDALRSPFNLAGDYDAGPVPALGEHTEEIRAEASVLDNDELL